MPLRMRDRGLGPPGAALAPPPSGGDGDAGRQEAAVGVALRTGLLRRCPAHGRVYDPLQHDYQGACMVAGYLVNQSDPLVAAFRGDRASLAELLKAICAGYPASCGDCDAGR